MDDYWDRPCVACRAEERYHTNLECIEEIAKITGTPLEEAKILFRKPEVYHSEQTDWDIFRQEYQKERE